MARHRGLMASQSGQRASQRDLLASQGGLRASQGRWMYRWMDGRTDGISPHSSGFCLQKGRRYFSPFFRFLSPKGQTVFLPILQDFAPQKRSNLVVAARFPIRALHANKLDWVLQRNDEMV